MGNQMQSLIASVALVAGASAAIQTRACMQPEVVQDFNIEAFLGLWYEIVRDKDTSYEHGICNTAQYALKDDGNIRVLNNEWYDDEQIWCGGEGYAFVLGPFLSKEYVWVLAREPVVSDETKVDILAALEKIPKYDIFENGAYTPQPPSYDCPYDSQPL